MVPKLINKFDLLELQRLHRKIHRSRTVQIQHSLVAGSLFLNGKKTAKKLSQLHALEPARYAVIVPANTYYICIRFLAFTFVRQLNVT